MRRTPLQTAALQLMGPFTVSCGSATPHEDVKPEVAELDATLALQPPQLRHNERHQELPVPHSYEIPLAGNTIEDETARQHISEYDRPPDLDIKTYHGHSSREFEDWFFELSTYFKAYSVWFSYSPHKILAAASHLSSDLLYKWSIHERGCTTTSWTAFEKWCRSLVDTRSDTQRYLDASKAFYGMRQRPSETVLDFFFRIDAFWFRLEHPPRNDVEFRKEFLGRKVLRSIRDEDAKYYPDDTMSYMDYMGHLRRIEDRLPARQRVLRKRRNMLRKKSARANTGAPHVPPNRSLLWRMSRPNPESQGQSGKQKTKKARGRKRPRYSDPAREELVL